MQTWALIADCFREAFDRKIFWVMVAITLIVTSAMACIGFDERGISFLFGVWRLEYSNPAFHGGLAAIGIPLKFVAAIAINILDTFVGWIGAVLALVATAGIFPRFMERGAIDVPLAKPLPRWKLFLGKYLGSMVFILMQATLFVALTFVVIGLRWRAWLPGYLLSIPLMVILFSYLYGVCALVGVMTRSTATAILVSLAAWLVFATPATVLQTMSIVQPRGNGRIVQVARLARWVLPKTGEVAYIAGRWAGAGIELDVPVPPPAGFADDNQAAAMRELSEQQLKISALKSIGSSLAFELVIVLLAMRRFSKTDF
ncbi:MAG TPA: ABC transporter permease subunit [Phycisphaerae bacterium]|jgi:ABC-type transport system involved in multi-copper enzyme maturation permease subunit